MHIHRDTLITCISLRSWRYSPEGGYALSAFANPGCICLPFEELQASREVHCSHTCCQASDNLLSLQAFAMQTSSKQAEGLPYSSRASMLFSCVYSETHVAESCYRLHRVCTQRSWLCFCEQRVQYITCRLRQSLPCQGPGSSHLHPRPTGC